MITSGDSANLVKIADNLKGLTDNALEREKQNPNGFAPVYMIVSEQQRRDKLRKQYPGDPQTTVAQDLSMASQAYQGKDVLTGIMAGGQPPMMQQPQMAAYGGLMGYNEGGIVGYANGTQPGAVPEEEEERRNLFSRTLDPLKQFFGMNEANQARLAEIDKLNKQIGDLQGAGGYLGNLNPFKSITDAEYDKIKQLEAEKKRLLNIGDPDSQMFGNKKLVKPEDKFMELAKKPLQPKKDAKDAKETVVDKTKKSTGTGTGTGIKGGQPKGGQPTPPPNPFAELLKQEYEMSKKAYADQQAEKSRAGKLAAIVGGLTLAGTGNLAQAGIAGLDAFQGEKDKRRNQLAQLAKARSDAARGYASGMLDLEKLGISRADLKRKANKDLKDLEIAARKAGAAFTKNEVDLAKAIITNDPTVTAQQAMNQARRAVGKGASTKPISLSDTRQYSLGL